MDTDTRRHEKYDSLIARCQGLAPVPTRGHRGRRRPDLVALRLARPHLACPHCDAAAVILAHRLLPHEHRTNATPAGQAAE